MTAARARTTIFVEMVAAFLGRQFSLEGVQFSYRFLGSVEVVVYFSEAFCASFPDMSLLTK